jgi:hypothetical protein
MKKAKIDALYHGFGLILVLGIMSLAGLFAWPGGLLYDQFVRGMPDRSPSSSHVLLVSSDFQHRYSGDEIWLSLMERLDTLGAEQIIFSFLPQNVSPHFYERAEALGNVIFASCCARQWRADPALSDRAVPLSLPFQGKKLDIAFNDVPETQYGIHRFVKRYRKGVAGELVPHIVEMAAQKKLQRELLPGERFAINFHTHKTGLPNMDLQRILTGNVVSSLIKEKSVLIGFHIPKPFHGFQTPLHPHADTMSLLEYNGYALDTLLEQKEIAWPGPWGKLLVIALVVLIGLLGYPLVSPAYAILYSVLTAGGAIAVAWISLMFFQVWIPLAEWLVAQLLILLMVLIQDINVKDRMTRQMIFTQSIRIRKRFFQAGFFSTEHYWRGVIHMINQTLNLERAIFLEKVPRDHRVKVIIALNTSISDISERRRDYERSPYSDALEAGRPIHVKTFFKSISDDHQQYLVPLTFSGQVEGFWAFALKAEDALKRSGILPVARSMALEIGELLYQRRQWKLQKKRQSGLLRKLINPEARQEVFLEVRNIMNLMERRLKILESVSNAMHTGNILYNLFGQVVQVNQVMIQRLDEMDIRPFEMTALDLAVQLTGQSPETIRQKMTRAILDQQPLSLPVTVARNGKSFRLYISSLAEDAGGHTEADEAYPFDLYGILFEMIDMTDVQELQNLKAQLFEHSVHYIRSDVESLSNVCSYLEDSSRYEDKKDELLHIVEQQKEKLMDFIHRLNGYMGREGIVSSIGVFPVNPLKIIEETTAALHEKLAERNLGVEVSPSTLTELVLAVPDDFKRLLYAIFMILINDADEETTIWVQLSVEKRRVLCHFENSGYGMPDDIFQTYLSEEGAAPSEFFKTIRFLTPGLRAWQASLSGHSELGQGIRFVLKLMKF